MTCRERASRVTLTQTEPERERRYPVKVSEGRAELIHLLLADALGIAGQDLGLDLVDGSGNGGEELLPAHTDVLAGHMS